MHFLHVVTRVSCFFKNLCNDIQSMLIFFRVPAMVVVQLISEYEANGLDVVENRFHRQWGSLVEDIV